MIFINILKLLEAFKLSSGVKFQSYGLIICRQSIIDFVGYPQFFELNYQYSFSQNCISYPCQPLPKQLAQPTNPKPTLFRLKQLLISTLAYPNSLIIMNIKISKSNIAIHILSPIFFDIFQKIHNLMTIINRAKIPSLSRSLVSANSQQANKFLSISRLLVLLFQSRTQQFYQSFLFQFLFEQLQIQSLHLNIEYLNSDLTSIMFDKYRAKQDNYLMRHPSKMNKQNTCFRGFNSPKHENNMTIDYNTYMKNQKNLLRQESFMYVPNGKEKRNFGGYQRKQNMFGIQYDWKVNQLTKQNDFLIDQLMKSKQKQEKYQKAINRLKRCKSETILQPSYQSLVKINQTKCSQTFSNNCITSKLINQMDESSKRSKKSQNQLQQNQICKQLLEQSSMYIYHSQKSMAWQIQELNNKLCNFIEKSTVELDIKARNNYRLKISECVKQLKQLRKLYEQTYS